jgi:hypothetical protein
VKKGSDQNTNQRLVDVSSYIMETDYDKNDKFFSKINLCLHYCTFFPVLSLRQKGSKSLFTLSMANNVAVGKLNLHVISLTLAVPSAFIITTTAETK